MKETVIWLLLVAVVGIVGASARYIHELGKTGKGFKFAAWAMNAFVGVAIAMVVGLLAKELELSITLTSALVAMAAISSKELMDALPEIAVKIAKTRVK